MIPITRISKVIAAALASCVIGGQGVYAPRIGSAQENAKTPVATTRPRLGHGEFMIHFRFLNRGINGFDVTR